MSDLVKTKFEIFAEIDETIVSGDKDEYKELILDKVLVLPSGLDKLEEMLKKEFPKRGFIPGGETIDVVEDIFARFKQEHGVK